MEMLVMCMISGLKLNSFRNGTNVIEDPWYESMCTNPHFLSVLTTEEITITQLGPLLKFVN